MALDKRWTPVRKGDIFCSPACGAKCTMQAFEDATNKAAALCQQMGPGWKPHVWENLGWHWEAHHGPLTLRPTEFNGATEYTAWITGVNWNPDPHNPHKNGMSYGLQMISGYHKAPEKALAEAVRSLVDKATEVVVAANEAVRCAGPHVSVDMNVPDTALAVMTECLNEAAATGVSFMKVETRG